MKMKKYKHGLVLGKFMPPHYGHLYLIDTALEQSEKVDLLICSLESEPIPGKLRYSWLCELYSTYDNLTIHWIAEDLPQSPEEHGDIDDFYNVWCDVVDSKVDTLDVIFTSEEYGEEFAGYLGIKHHMVDLDRVEVPTSGTEIRNNPGVEWEYLPQVVKPYFKRKIAIVGPESTGKSTLTKILAKHFNGDFVEEYGREYTDEIPAKTMDISDYEEIATEHFNKVNDTIKNGYEQLIFVDTDALITYSFGKMYMGKDFSSKEITKIIHDEEYDLFLLCSPDVPWVDDGTRDFKKERIIHFNMIRFLLDIYGKPYVIINGDNYEDRFEQAKEEVFKVLMR